MSATTVRRMVGLRGMACTAHAFVRMGFLQSISYPMSFVTEQAAVLVPAVIYLFIGRLVGNVGPQVGGDYYTFVMVGLITVTMMAPGIQGLSKEIELTVVRGNFEMLLVEPVPWRLLPFGIVLWPAVLAVSAVIVLSSSAALLGADFRLAGIGPAVLILALAFGASLTFGLLSASVKVLAKKGDPVVFFYMVVVQIFSGVYFPIEQLPAPLRVFSWLIPHTYANTALRRVLMEDGATMPGMSLLHALVGLVAFTTVGLAISLWLFGKAMQVGRRYGLLTGY